MPVVCTCGNVKDEQRFTFTLREGPCRCEDPGRDAPSLVRLRVPPVDLHQPRDPKRRRLGLPGMSPIERAILPKDQHGRYE